MAAKCVLGPGICREFAGNLSPKFTLFWAVLGVKTLDFGPFWPFLGVIKKLLSCFAACYMWCSNNIGRN